MQNFRFDFFLDFDFSNKLLVRNTHCDVGLTRIYILLEY